ncbi:SapC family protein [Pseudomonas syringae]|uniref:SapC family protein n=1 Tax=Pseudomonas syringae TaxID=317 RepID=UPI00068D8C4A|nr:SapC family protein [Pseudomonas syringae]
MTNYVPINNEIHKDKRWIRPTSLAFLANEVIAPLFADEVAEAMHAMPIAFIPHNDGFALVAVMGLKPGGNLLVSRDGRWQSSYMPFVYRSRPFQLLDTNEKGDQQVLCIDEACISADDDKGEPFFENGEITDFIQKIFTQEQRYKANRQLTTHISTILAEHDLIKPWNIVIDESSGDQQPLVGLYRVDEVALNALSDEAFLALRQANALAVIYSHLLSLQNINALSARLPAVEPLEDATSSRETFDFAGL